MGRKVGRVGITTDVAKREAQWKAEYPNMKNWEILSSGLTKNQAQEQENAIAADYDYDSSPGGNDPDDPNATWSVYKFEY